MEQDRKPSVGIGAQLTASLHGNDPTKISAEEPSSMLLANSNVDNTPPSREDGFVMFKAEQGLSLNKIFAENKGNCLFYALFSHRAECLTYILEEFP